MKQRTYRLVIEGELDDRFTDAFGAMTLTRDHGNTTLTGPIRDQADFQGLLQRIAGLGLTLVSANPLGDQDSVQQATKGAIDD
jgi:hypothetical protein